MAKNAKSLDSDESLESRILKDLRATGFPHEITTGIRLEQQKWSVSLNDVYVEETSREIDILAQRFWTATHDDRMFSLYVTLVTECKKSDDPWVFFTPPQRKYGEWQASFAPYSILAAPVELLTFQAAGGSQTAEDRDASQALREALSLRDHHYAEYVSERPWARTYHEPFKRQGERAPQIYAAVSAVTQAARHYLHADVRRYGPVGALRLYYPLIVFKGNLFEASVDGTGEVTVAAVQQVQLDFRTYAPQEASQVLSFNQGTRFIVDVVHESFLEGFLSTIEEEHGRIASSLQTALEGGRISGAARRFSRDQINEIVKRWNLAEDTKSS